MTKLNRREFLNGAVLSLAAFASRGIRLPKFIASRGPCTLFVDSNAGDDSYDGLARATAKKTLSGAIDDARSGDRIFVVPGVYYETQPLAIPCSITMYWSVVLFDSWDDNRSMIDFTGSCENSVIANCHFRVLSDD